MCLKRLANIAVFQGQEGTTTAIHRSKKVFFQGQSMYASASDTPHPWTLAILALDPLQGEKQSLNEVSLYPGCKDPYFSPFKNERMMLQTR